MFLKPTPSAYGRAWSRSLAIPRLSNSFCAGQGRIIFAASRSGLEYDPQVLQFDEYVSPDQQTEPLVWLQPGASGATTVAVALSGRHSPFPSHAAGSILFRRLLLKECEIRLGSVLSFVGQENRRVVATAPRRRLPCLRFLPKSFLMRHIRIRSTRKRRLFSSFPKAKACRCG